MISFKTRNDAVSGALMIIGLILLFGTAGWIAFVKYPNEQPIPRGPESNLKSVQQQIEGTDKNNTAAIVATNALVWDGTAEEVTPLAQGKVLKLAMANHLKVTAFRPQKPVDVQGITQIPLNLTVDGTYPDMMKLVKDLESEGTKLAISLVQLNTAETSTDHVAGTIELMAYLKATQPAAAAPKGGTNAKKS